MRVWPFPVAFAVRLASRPSPPVRRLTGATALVALLLLAGTVGAQGPAPASGAPVPTPGPAAAGPAAPVPPASGTPALPSPTVDAPPPPLAGSPAPASPAPPGPAAADDSLALGAAGARGVGIAPPGYTANSFIDTRLTWTFGDDDIINRTGQLTPLSPAFSIGDRPQYRLFFDSLNSRFAGRENLTHLVLYKKLPAYLPNLTTEAAVVLRFDLAALASNSGNPNTAFYDSGSYIRLFYKTAEGKGAQGALRDAGVSAVFFPIDTDRFRLGYLYDISWGGTDPRINESIFPRIQGAAPGLKLQYEVPDRYYVFAGFKTATIVQPVQVLNPGAASEVEVVRVGETNFGLLGGGGGDPKPWLHLDAGLGLFQQGKFDLEDVRGRPVYTYGGSMRAVVHKDMPVPESVDFRLYRNDPMAPMVLFAPRRYREDELSWSVAGELSVLGQHLKDFDTSGRVKEQVAVAGALTGVVTAGYLRASLAGIFRTLPFVVRNVPGFIPFHTLPSDSKGDPELFTAATLTYYVPALRLTPEMGGGVQLPATFKSVFSEGGVPAQRAIVVRRQGDESILPYGEDRRAILQARLAATWTLSEMLSTVVWSQLVYDNNGTLVVRDPQEGTASLRVFQKPTRLGFGLALQARF